MRMKFGGILGLIILIADIWAIVSIIGSNASSSVKVLWILLELVFPIVGLIVWLHAGPRSARRIVCRVLHAICRVKRRAVIFARVSNIRPPA